MTVTEDQYQGIKAKIEQAMEQDEIVLTMRVSDLAYLIEEIDRMTVEGGYL